MTGFNPAGVSDVVQGADAGRARPRLPLAGPPARARPRARSRIFNRSHYEDVLVVRVHNFVPEEVWRRRYDQINAFEHAPGRRGHHDPQVLPVHLAGEQLQRFQDRVDDPTKRWKFKTADLEERKLWDDYTGRVRGRAVQVLDGLGALVRHPGEQEVVPEPRGRATIVADTLERDEPAVPARRAGIEKLKLV